MRTNPKKKTGANSRKTIRPVVGPGVKKAGLAGLVGFTEASPANAEHIYASEHENFITLEYDLSGKIIYFNKKAQEFFGYSEKEILGKDISILVFGKKQPKAAKNGLKKIHQGMVIDPGDERAHLNENVLRDGRRVWISWRSRPVSFKNGKPVLMMAVGRDITRQKNIEDSLEELKRIIGKINDGVSIIDESGKFLFINERAAEMLGYCSGGMIGRNVAEFIEKGDLPLFTREIKARKTGLIGSYEIRMRHREGYPVCATITSTPRFDRLGNFIGSYTIITDITERKRAEAALRAREAQFRSIFDNSRDAIFLVNSENYRIVEANDTACKLYGYSKEEFKDLELFKISAEPESSLKAIIAETKIIPYRLHKKKDGTVFPVEISIGFFKLGDTDLHTASIRDISRRVEAQERLLGLNRTLRALGNANKALLRATDEKTLLHDICRIISDDCGYSMVWIGFAQDDAAKSVESVAQVGMGKDYLKSINLSWGDNERSRSPMGASIRTGKTRVCRDVKNDPDFAIWKPIAARYGYASAVAFPLNNQEKTFGAIGIYSRQTDGFSDDEIALLTDLANNLAYGIVSLRLRKERQKNEILLRQTTQYLNNLLSFANMPIIVWGTDYTITRFNSAAEQLTGLRTEQIIGKDMSVLFSCCDPDAGNRFKTDLAGARWKTIEATICRPDGSKRDVVWNLANVYGPDMERVAAVIALGEDITDRKIAQAQIEKYLVELSREKKRIESLMLRIADEKKMLDGIIENTEALIAYLDSRFNFVKINTAYCREYECLPKDVIGKNFFSFFAESEVEVKSVLKELRREGAVVKRPAMPYYNERHPERGMTYRDLIASPIKDAQGKVSGIVLLYLDATQRVRDEKNLALHSKRLQEMVNDLRKLQMAVENASDIIFTVDAQGVITSINKAVSSILGYQPQELVGRPATFLGGSERRQEHILAWDMIKKQKKPFSREIVNIKKNGQAADFDLHISPVTDSHGEIISYIGIERDRSELKAVDRAKKDFISMASHQLRTPLATISLSAQMLASGAIGNIDDDARNQVEEIFKITHQMAALIDLFLNASRIEFGRLEIDPQPVELPLFIQDLMKPIEPLAAVKKIELKSEVAGDVEKLNIDRKVMNMVLENLLTNALKYTPVGGKVSLLVKKEGQDMVFAVSDTGVGVPKKQLHLLFNKMFRASNVGEASGYGLGLSMAKNVVEQSGGRIWAQTKQNQGSSFFVAIPVSGMKRKEITFES